MSLCSNINRLLAARGMTQADLARATGLSTSQVAYLANGTTSDPRASTLEKTASALGCSIDDLLRDEPGTTRTKRPPQGSRPASGPAHSPAFHGQQTYRDILSMYAGREPTPVERRLSEGLRGELRAKTFDEVTVMAICRNAQVGRRTFYRHFLDKYDLLTWTFYQDLCVNIPHEDSWVSWDYVPVICSFFERDRNFYKHACLVRGPNSLREFASARMFPIVMHDFADLQMDEVQLDTFIDRCIGMVYDSIEYWLIEEPDVPADVFAARFRRKMTALLQRLVDTITQPPARGAGTTV